MLTCVNYTRWDSTIKSFCILSSVNVSVNIKVNVCSDEAMILPGRLKECRWLRLRTINSSQAAVICRCDISIVKVRRCRCCRMHSSHSRGLSRAAALCHRLRPRLLFRFWLLWSDSRDQTSRDHGSARPRSAWKWRSCGCWECLCKAESDLTLFSVLNCWNLWGFADLLSHKEDEAAVWGRGLIWVFVLYEESGFGVQLWLWKL